MIDKLKWVFLAAIAVIAGFLGLLYGKKTPAELRAKARAHNAKGRVINKQIEAAEKQAEAENDEEKRQFHVERANTLKVDRAELQKARAQLLEETGDLDVSDAELANLRNASKRGSSVG